MRLVAGLPSLIDRVLLPVADEPIEALRKRRVCAGATLAMLVQSTLVLIATFAFAAGVLPKIAFGLAIASHASTLWLLRTRRSLRGPTSLLAATVLVVLGTVALHHDGAVVMFQPIVVATPLFGVYLRGRRAGTMILAFLIAETVLIVVCHQLGWTIAADALPPQHVPILAFGAIVGTCGTFWITWLHEDDRAGALRASEEQATRLAEAQETAHMGSWEWDLVSGEAAWSQELLRIYGLPADGRVDLQAIMERIHPDDRARVWSTTEGSVARNEPFQIEFRILRPQGDERRLVMRGHLRADKDPPTLIGLTEDVTEKRGLEDRLRQAEKLSAIGRLAAGLAHEINNPLTVILGFAQGMERRLADADAMRTPVASIVRETTRCRTLVHELLTFSRSEPPRTERTDLNELVRATATLLDVRARGEGIEILQALAPDGPAVLANKSQLQQVLMNLGTNALDAMTSGGKLTLRTSLDGPEAVTIEVIDTGEGIPEHLRSSIFEPFFTTKEVGKGTGLGLALVYEIVQQHHGAIAVAKEEPRGTRMTVRLPLAALPTPG